MMIITYVDNFIISGRSIKDIDSFIYSMKHGSENFILTDEVDVNKFLGIEITRNEDSSFEMSQPLLIDRLLLFLDWVTMSLIQAQQLHLPRSFFA